MRSPGSLFRISAFFIVLTSWCLYIFSYLYPYNQVELDGGFYSFQFVCFFIRTFELHLGVFVFCMSILLFVLGARFWSAIGLVLFLFCTVPATINMMPKRTLAFRPNTDITVISANIRVKNKTLEQAGQALQKTGASMLFIQEYSPTVHQVFQPLLEPSYPYRVYAPYEGFGGAAVYSKIPFLEEEIITDIYAANVDNPLIRVQVAVEGAVVTFYNIHLYWQIGKFAQQQRRDLVHQWLANEEGPAVALGDYNFTERSPQHWLFKQAGYVDALDLVGWGLKATWPTQRFADWIVIPKIRLDHVYVTKQLGAKDLKIFDIPGADHKAVQLTLGIQDKRFD